MQTELQTEVVLCPNCREEVPKTLYCLNCGYPLYKMNLDSPKHEEDVRVEVEPEPFSLESLTKLAESAETTTDKEELTVAPAIEETEAEIEHDDIEEPVETVEPLLPEVTEEKVEFEELETFEDEEEVIEPEDEIIEPTTEIVEVTDEEVADEETASMEVEEVTEAPEATEEITDDITIEEPITEVIVEPVYKPEVQPIFETVVEPIFEPEPVIKEVMENLAKNISTKIKLVNLLREGGVKTETFNRLFESYVARGELLMNSRNEMLERVRFDIESMERALNEAKIGLEELKIRKAIGDASEEEYRAKSPGFEWDIKQYEDEVARKRAEIKYLEDLTQVMNAEEIEELKLTGESSCEAVDGLSDAGKISSETATRVKVALEEDLAYLKASCC
ncbi:MAG: hypothetical protein OEW93_00660 [Candidatus Bathyarchaeota archaeon]|nr:hypothetical protein [Candidatus Bathyarchaeota archaeon]MDH5790666.1 hypothetical protein [Candidatus Bathyarchaeota archaeon]